MKSQNLKCIYCKTIYSIKIKLKKKIYTVSLTSQTISNIADVWTCKCVVKVLKYLYKSKIYFRSKDLADKKRLQSFVLKCKIPHNDFS